MVSVGMAVAVAVAGSACRWERCVAGTGGRICCVGDEVDVDIDVDVEGQIVGHWSYEVQAGSGRVAAGELRLVEGEGCRESSDEPSVAC